MTEGSKHRHINEACILNGIESVLMNRCLECGGVTALFSWSINVTHLTSVSPKTFENDLLRLLGECSADKIDWEMLTVLLRPGRKTDEIRQ